MEKNFSTRINYDVLKNLARDEEFEGLMTFPPDDKEDEGEEKWDDDDNKAGECSNVTTCVWVLMMSGARRE